MCYSRAQSKLTRFVCPFLNFLQQIGLIALSKINTIPEIYLLLFLDLDQSYHRTVYSGRKPTMTMPLPLEQLCFLSVTVAQDYLFAPRLTFLAVRLSPPVVQCRLSRWTVTISHKHLHPRRIYLPKTNRRFYQVLTQEIIELFHRLIMPYHPSTMRILTSNPAATCHPLLSVAPPV